MILDGYGGYIWRCDVCAKDFNHAHADDCPWGSHRTDWQRCTCGMKELAEKEGSESVRDLWKLFYVMPVNTAYGHRNYYTGYREPPGTPPDFPQELCRDCAMSLTNTVQRFAESFQIDFFCRQLQRAIYDKRKQGRA